MNINNEELRIMTAQYWASAEADIDEFMEGVNIEFIRLYLQGMERVMLDSNGEVTEEEARAYLEKFKGSVAFDRMMIKFVMEVVEKSADAVQVVMNSEHREWIRYKHQRYQALKMYTGDKKRTVQPKLYGVPIVIDETATEPRLE